MPIIPVDQTRFNFVETLTEPPGNCWAACICTLFGIHLSQFPDEADTWEPGITNAESWKRYYPIALKWIEDQGYNLIEVEKKNIYSHNSFNAYCILSGPSPRNNSVNHAVVGHGFNIHHDPHPSRDGLHGEPKDWWVEMLITKEPQYHTSNT